MNARSLRLVFIALAASALLAAARLHPWSAYAIYMQAPGVTGDVTAPASYAGWIEINSFSFGASNPANLGGSSGGGHAGKTTFGEFTVTKIVDRTSPLFIQYFGLGKHFGGSLTVDLVRAGGVNEQVKIFNPIVSAESIGGNGGDGPEQQTVVFQYSAMQYCYTQQTAGSHIPACAAWNLVCVCPLYPRATPSPSPTPCPNGCTPSPAPSSSCTPLAGFCGSPSPSASPSPPSSPSPSASPTPCTPASGPCASPSPTPCPIGAVCTSPSPRDGTIARRRDHSMR